MNCPKCHSSRTTKNGRNDLGTQRYKCKDCGWSGTGNTSGRPTVHDDGLSDQQRWNRANQEKMNDAQRRRRKKLKGDEKDV